MGTYDELRYKKTHIFAYVRMGQPTGSKEINNICHNQSLCLFTILPIHLDV